MTAEELRRWALRRPRPRGPAGRYGVLLLLGEGPGGLSLLFEVRSDTLERQPGEICLPGGRLEGEETPTECALRETWEELSIPPERVEVLGELEWLVNRENIVYPVVGIVDQAGQEALSPSPAEVKETFWVPLEWLRTHPPEVYPCRLIPQVGEDFPNGRIGFPQGYPWREGRMEVPIYTWEGKAIWGLTGRVLRRFLEELP